MRAAIYRAQDIQAWEQRWFAAGNSSYGLMQQAAWQMALSVHQRLQQQQASSRQLAGQWQALVKPVIGVWCGAGNNGGDGYLLAAYLQQMGWQSWLFQAAAPNKPVAQQACDYARQHNVPIYSQVQQLPASHVDVDALFGIGLNRIIDGLYAGVIQQFNQRPSYKVALDIPSGLAADTGAVLGAVVRADLTLTVLGYKAGLFTGQGAAYAGKVICLQLIAPDTALKPLAYLDQVAPVLPKRTATGHKGTHGHVLIVGGDADMGGAAIMAVEAALTVGAGKATLLTHPRHHAAALTRSPNVMTLALPESIKDITPEFVRQACAGKDVVVIGMGLGRHDWGRAVWQAFFPLLLNQQVAPQVVIDADGLYFLAETPGLDVQPHWYITPHSGEAARLLHCETAEVEQDRIAAVESLSQRYARHALLKGAGSLSMDDGQLSICALGNAGMGTAGMGDILAGMLGGLLAQFSDFPLHQAVALHAHAGDLLACSGQRGMQASDMLTVLKRVVNTGGVQL